MRRPEGERKSAAAGEIDLRRAEERQPGIIQSDSCFTWLPEQGKSVCTESPLRKEIKREEERGIERKPAACLSDVSASLRICHI